MSEWTRESTIRELYGPAMEIADEAEATAYFERLVAHHMEHFGQSRDEAETIQRANLGYYAGYYDHETRQRVERVFCCAHPIFGKAGTEPVKPEDAILEGFTRACEADL